MNTISLQLPDSLYRKLKEFVKRDGISVNQFITTAAAEKLSAIETVAYLRRRAKRSSDEAFRQALSEVPDVEPADYDRL